MFTAAGLAKIASLAIRAKGGASNLASRVVNALQNKDRPDQNQPIYKPSSSYVQDPAIDTRLSYLEEQIGSISNFIKSKENPEKATERIVPEAAPRLSAGMTTSPSTLGTGERSSFIKVGRAERPVQNPRTPQGRDGSISVTINLVSSLSLDTANRIREAIRSITGAYKPQTVGALSGKYYFVATFPVTASTGEGAFQVRLSKLNIDNILSEAITPQQEARNDYDSLERTLKAGLLSYIPDPVIRGVIAACLYTITKQLTELRQPLSVFKNISAHSTP